MGTAIAAGHPATTAAGAEILAEGGNAADAAVAACLASCVAESLMTGLLGGGHAIYHDASSGETWNLDFFVAMPGLGGDRRDAKLVELPIPFGSELIHYSVGPASCGVPGVPAGVDALWRRFGSLPWPRLVEPALRLAVGGVELPRAHAACLDMLAAVMTMDAGAAIYSPGGSLLREGDRLHQPGLVAALEVLADEGPSAAYDGTLAESLVALMDDRGGLVTRDDLRAYEAEWHAPIEVAFRGTLLRTRPSLGAFAAAVGRLEPLRGHAEPARALALVAALGAEAPADAGTTNISVLDGDGSACALTTSLGLGSGDFLPGFDLHLNSMLGETDLLTGPLAAGQRVSSMMAPEVALEDGRVILAAGAAGGTRLRSALLQVTAGVLDEGLEPAVAVDRPRLHRVESLVHLEPGFEQGTVDALEAAGYATRVWPSRHHYFGGVSVVTPSAASGDPRRSGDARVLR